MRESQASLTAATVGMVNALNWHENNNKLSQLQAELMRNISWRDMPLPLWLLLRMILCHEVCTRLFLKFWMWCLGKSQAFNGVWHRKLYMERQVRTFLEAQKENDDRPQVLIVAAGYDTLAWRLATEYPHVNFVELDHPATGKAKLKALENLLKKRRANNMDTVNNTKPIQSEFCPFSGTTLPPLLNFCHVAVGEEVTVRKALLEKPVADVAALGLRKASVSNSPPCFVPKTPTAIVMEGLSFYLTQQQNKDLIQQLGELAGCDGSILAFDFFHLDDCMRPMNRNTKKVSPLVGSFMKYKVKLFGEPFKWGIDPLKLPSFLQDTPWRLISSRETWNHQVDEQFPFATVMGIEYEATARWDGNAQD